MKKKRDGFQKGFTLVELIVVLVILAILLAILVPGMTQWIKKAKYQQAFQECRTVVLSAQGLCAERYATEDTADAPAVPADEAEILKMAGTKEGTGIRTLGLSQDGTEVSYLIYRASDGTLVQYFDGEYSLFTANLGEETTRQNVIDMMHIKVDGIGCNRVDSGAIGVINKGSKGQDVESHASAAVAKLQQQGLSLSAMDAVSWHWETTQSGDVFLWTNQDISDKNVKDPVAYIKYDASDGTYSVWTSQVAKETLNGTTYNVLSTANSEEYATETEIPDKTYAGALKVLKEAQQKTGELNP